MSAKPNRREQRAQAQQFISSLQGTAFPNSKRIWIAGSRPDIRVPMREIQLSPTLIGGDKTIRFMKPMNRCLFTIPPARMAIPRRKSMFIRACRVYAAHGSNSAATAN